MSLNKSTVNLREEFGKGKQLVIMVGNIASGKTTVVRQLSTLRFMQVVSLDALRYMLGAGTYYFGGNTERVIWKAEWKIITDLMKFRYNIIVDDAKNMSIAHRAPLIELAKKHKYKVIVVETPTISKKDSVARRLKDNHGNTSAAQWGRVYDKFKSMYCKPTAIEGIDQYIKLKEEDGLHELFLQVGVK